MKSVTVDLLLPVVLAASRWLVEREANVYYKGSATFRVQASPAHVTRCPRGMRDWVYSQSIARQIACVLTHSQIFLLPLLTVASGQPRA